MTTVEIGTCDQCQEEAEIWPIDLMEGDMEVGTVMLCEKCADGDEPISVAAQFRARDREAERWAM